MTTGHLLTDSRVQQGLREPTDALLRGFASGGLEEQRALEKMAELAAAGIENHHELARLTVSKVADHDIGTEQFVNRLAGLISDLQAAYAPWHDANELTLRGRPLRQLWEARGPGLLRQLENHLEPGLIVEHADVVLVRPAVGGHGIAHPRINTVMFEGVLANPHEQLPEVARLGWLLAQLNSNSPKLAEAVTSSRLPTVVGLAFLPATLWSAEVIELVQLDNDLLRSAIAAWCGTDDLIKDQIDEVSEVVATWWQTHREQRAAWPAALAALDRMLEESHRS